MKVPEHIALIGCGFTGTSAFFQLIEHYPVKEITIFEASGRFGPGYPYHPDECHDYLLNNTTDTMGIAPSNRRAFVEWLNANPDIVPDFKEKGHLPRSVYGAFLEDVFAATRAAAAIKGVKINLVAAEVTEVREDEMGRVLVSWASGEKSIDMAILTTGRCPDIDAYEHPPSGSSAQYFPSHIMSVELDELALDAKVHVLGASLSAYDVVNRLFSENTGCNFGRDSNGSLIFSPGRNKRSLVLCSRSGQLKSMQSRKPVTIKRKYFTYDGLCAAAAIQEIKLDDVANLIREEAKAHSAEINWRKVIAPYQGCKNDADVNARAGSILKAAISAAKKGGPKNFLVEFFDDAQIDVWDCFARQLLSCEDEQKYRSNIETAVLSYAAPCPISTGEKLLAIHRAGQLTVLRGVRKVALAHDGSRYVIEHDFGTDRAKILINTTGQVDRKVTSARQSFLVRNLAASGLLKAYVRDGIEMNGAAVDMATFRVAGAQNIYLANMFLWGPGFFTSSAFMMATIVERLLIAAFGGKT